MLEDSGDRRQAQQGSRNLGDGDGQEPFPQRGWTCPDVSGPESLDIMLVKDDERVHVEVKGLTGPGNPVTLTANEVSHAETFPRCILAVVENIGVEKTPGGPVASGGTLRRWDPWTTDEDRLRPTQYRYDLN